MAPKHFYLGLSLLLAGGNLHAADLTLAIEGYRSAEGYLMISVHRDQDSYDSDSGGIVYVRQTPVVDGHQLTFRGLTAGEYAVKAFHDENGNGVLDTNVLGIPSESYGFSGPGKVRGAASFQDAKVELQDDLTITLDLR